MVIISDEVNPTSSPRLELVKDASSNDSQPEQPSLPGTSLRESKSTEWTDEKHSLYLKSMETSFVNQLYNSANFSRSQSLKRYLTNTHSHKFKVLKRGCWQKVVYEGEKPQLSETVNKFCDQGILVSPWIQRFRSSKSQKLETSPILDNCEASTSGQASNLRKEPSSTLSKQPDIGRSNLSVNNLLSDDIVEVSDQNFVDEEDCEEVKADKSSLNPEWIKTVEGGATGNDQVVPFNKESTGGEEVGENCGS